MKKIAASPLRAGLFQALVMLLLALCAALLPALLDAAYLPLKVLLQWIVLPLAGAFTAALFSLAGVTCYLTWIMPPVIVSAAPWLVIGYPLSPGVMLLCVLISMLGASTGEVLRKRLSHK